MASTHLVLYLLFVGVSFALNVDVLSPVRTAPVEAAIIITPGASIKGEAYKPLAQALQAECNVRLWVVLLEGFLFDTPNPLQLGSAVDMALKELKKQGMKSDNVFLAGHSLGGVFVGSYGKSNAGKLKGVLLLASYLTKGTPLQSYPLPVLTISGDLDGLTRITRIVDTFEELQGDIIKSPDAKYRTPVIVMAGVDHGDFASGVMPSNVKSHDLKSEVTLDTAHKMIAGHVNNFLQTTLQYNVTGARTGLEAAFNETAGMIKIFSTVKAWDQNSRQHSLWSVEFQKWIVGDSLSKLTQINSTVVSEGDLLVDEPFISNTSQLTVQTYTNVKMPFNPVDVSLNPQTPAELAIKMKTQASLSKWLPNVNTTSNNITCMGVNMELISLMLGHSSPRMQSRYTSRGKNAGTLSMQDDVIIENLQEWYSYSLNLQYGSNGSLDVTSYVYKTADHYYCKALSAYRLLEWIAIDSLKQT